MYFATFIDFTEPFVHLFMQIFCFSPVSPLHLNAMVQKGVSILDGQTTETDIPVPKSS